MGVVIFHQRFAGGKFSGKMENKIKSMIDASIEAKESCKKFVSKIEQASDIILDAFKNHNKILIAGNGGSASMSSHIAAEFVGRYKIERKGLPCIALACDMSIITAWSNDYGYDFVFERQIESLASSGDVFIALSTSGNSKNLIMAIDAAKKLNVRVIGLLGKDGGKMKGMSNVEIIVPSNNTPSIQEAHLMILHIICEIIDEHYGKQRKE